MKNKTCLNFTFPVKVVTEGIAKIHVPNLNTYVNTPNEYTPSKTPVFFNPTMNMNRDLAILALEDFQKKVDFLSVETSDRSKRLILL